MIIHRGYLGVMVLRSCFPGSFLSFQCSFYGPRGDFGVTEAISGFSRQTRGFLESLDGDMRRIAGADKLASRL